MNFSSKDFIIAVKNNWSVEDFAQHYKISSEDVLKAVDNSFKKPKDASQIKRQLKSNSKKQNKANTEAIIAVEEEVGNTTDIADDNSIETVDSVDNTVTNEEQHLSTSSLSALNAYEANLKEELYSTEILHKELITKKSTLMDKLKKERAKLLKLQAQLVEHKTMFNDFAREYSTVTSDIISVNDELLFLRNELEITRQAIDEAQKKVTIYIYSDSSIVPENFSGELPEVNSEMFKQFSVDERFEDLTLKELRQLCKLIALVDILKSDEKKSELIFDHEKLEFVYNMLNL